MYTKYINKYLYQINWKWYSFLYKLASNDFNMFYSELFHWISRIKERKKRTTILKYIMNIMKDSFRDIRY